MCGVRVAALSVSPSRDDGTGTFASPNWHNHQLRPKLQQITFEPIDTNYTAGVTQLDTLRRLLFDGPLWSRGSILRPLYVFNIFLNANFRSPSLGFTAWHRLPQSPFGTHRMYTRPSKAKSFQVFSFFSFALVFRSWNPTLPRCLTR